MRQEMIFSAIGDISDDLILDAEISSFALPNTIRLFRWKRLVAACLIIVMLAVPVSAEMINGYVSNLLAPLYGCAQTEIVDKIGKPIGASVIVDDYKLTADAIIGDQYSVAIVYSLSRIDGTPLEEGLTFQVYSNSLKTNGGASYSQFLSEDKSRTLYKYQYLPIKMLRSVLGNWRRYASIVLTRTIWSITCSMSILLGTHPSSSDNAISSWPLPLFIVRISLYRLNDKLRVILPR